MSFTIVQRVSARGLKFLLFLELFQNFSVETEKGGLEKRRSYFVCWWEVVRSSGVKFNDELLLISSLMPYTSIKRLIIKGDFVA
jgi:hypothetical protein